MDPRSRHRPMLWLIVLMLAFSAGPSSILIAYEPACRMGCAETEYCCCKPKARVVSNHATLQDPPADRETCPEGCATLSTVPQMKSATSATTGSVARDSNAETTGTVEVRFVSDLTLLDVEPRAPPHTP